MTDDAIPGENNGAVAEHGDWPLDNDDVAAADYFEQAREFLERSRIYLADGQLHRASEKGCGAAAHVAKPVALATIDSQHLAEAPERRVDIDIAGSRVAGAVTFEAAFDPRGARMRPVP